MPQQERDEESNFLEKLSVGQRIEVKEEILNVHQNKKFRGTIRYVGPLKCQSTKFSSEIWIGIEWDDWSDAIHCKNEGSVDGIRFFEPHKRIYNLETNSSSYMKCCSFLKPKKLQLMLLKPKSFINAIKSRYFETNEDEEDEKFESPWTEKQESSKSVPFLFVGKEKAEAKFSQLENLTNIHLEECRISDFGSEVETQTKIDILNKLAANLHIETLDLSNNLITSWETIVSMFEVMKNNKIQTLNLSGNKLQEISEKTPQFVEIWSKIFEKVEVLVLNDTEISISEVFWLVSNLFINLKQLYCCDMLFTDEDSKILANTQNIAQNLEILNFLGNNFNSWSIFSSIFGNLPKISELVLDKNQISSISNNFPENCWKNLKSLSIAHNKISEIETLNCLGTTSLFPSLTELRIEGNPINLEISNENINMVQLQRFEIIARIKNLKLLNRTIISKEERSEAEKWFVRNSGKKLLEIWQNSQNSTDFANSNAKKADFFKQNPRFLELIKIFGDPLEHLAPNGSYLEISSSESQKHQNPATKPTNTLNSAKRLSIKMVNCGKFDHLSSLVSELENVQTTTKKILSSTKVFQLKQIFLKTFKMDDLLQEEGDNLIVDLYCNDFKHNPERLLSKMTHLEDEREDINFYCVVDGHEILCILKDKNVSVSNNDQSSFELKIQNVEKDLQNKLEFQKKNLI